MKPESICTLLLALALYAPLVLAYDAASAIKTALNTQVEAWNRGNIPAFVSTYAEDCTFIGKQILQGRAQLTARYMKTYPSSEAMGKLTFGHLAVRMLDQQVAIVTGEWHLDRTTAAGGSIGGVFSLVWQFKDGTWRIVLDHTT